MTSSSQVPKSIQIWMCPTCGALGKTRGDVVTAPFGQQDMNSPCWRNAEHTEPVQAAYMLAEVTQEMRDRAARAIGQVTAGGIPFGKPSKRNTTRVSAGLVAEVALSAAFSTTRVEGGA